jgi:hypothetical protein
MNRTIPLFCATWVAAFGPVLKIREETSRFRHKKGKISMTTSDLAVLGSCAEQKNRGRISDASHGTANAVIAKTKGGARSAQKLFMFETLERRRAAVIVPSGEARICQSRFRCCAYAPCWTAHIADSA